MSETRGSDPDHGSASSPGMLSSQDSSAAGIAMKVCCVCGTNLRGRTRYKDSQGRYWCTECNEKDQLSKQPATCPDCQGEFTRADLVEFKGTPVCQSCWDKRKGVAKREEARLRAVEEAEREIADQKKRWKGIVWGFVAILALWGVIWLFYWLLAR